MSEELPEPQPAMALWKERGRRVLQGVLERPLLGLGLVAVLAILVADVLCWIPGPWTWAAMLAACLAGWRLRQRGWPAWAPLGALIFVQVHGWQLAKTYESPLRKELLALPARPHPMTMRARLLPWMDAAELDAGSAVGKLAVLSLGGRQIAAEGAVVRVSLPAGFVLEKPGLYEVSGTLSLPQPPMNPGQLDPVEFSLRNGWVAWVRADVVRLIQEESWAPAFHLLLQAEACRQWITRSLSRGIEEQPEDIAVLMAMALGASEAAGDDVEDAFRDSGTLHIFAVSGLHVVMLAVVISMGLRLFGLGKSRSAWVVILLVFAYAYITGWRPSAARAAIMIAIVLGALHWNRLPDVQNSLGCALLLLLLWDPHQLFMPGFQLSFLVLWSIAAFATPLTELLRPWVELDPFLPSSLAKWHHWFGRWLRRQFAGLACTSLAAWLGSLPLTLGHFHTLTPVGLVANLVLVPASGLSIGFSCVSLIAAGLGLGWVQSLANSINALLAQFMVWSATAFAALPGANVTLDLRFESEPPPMALHVFHVSAGGSAAHLRAGDSQWLIDTGNIKPWRRVVRPYLRQAGINHLDGLVLTHRDAAHSGAALMALNYDVGRVISSLHEPWALDAGPNIFDDLAASVKPDGSIWHRHQAGDVIRLPGEVRLEVLYPAFSDLQDLSDNRALVLMIHLGQTRVLWLGDAGFITEKRLLERRADLRCDVLVHGCHPRDAGGLPEFLAAAAPRLVVSESDSRFAEERLPERVREFCRSKGIRHFELEISGGIGVGVSAQGAQIKAHRSGETLFLPSQKR